jgi:hypothetical protein
MTEAEIEIETETLTRKDWILFLALVAFIVFLAVAVYIIIRYPPSYPSYDPLPGGTPRPGWH